MPDIAKCRGTNCPKKETCYRFKVKPNQYRQTYFGETPNDGETCKFYWEMKTDENNKSVR